MLVAWWRRAIPLVGGPFLIQRTCESLSLWAHFPAAEGFLLPLPTLVVVHQTDDAAAGDAPRHFFVDVLPRNVFFHAQRPFHAPEP